MNLRIPGPTPVRPEILAAAGRPMIDHRGPEMAALLEGLVAKLRRFLSTEADPIPLAGSGTAGLEAAVVNTLSPGARVLAVTGGVFGERFASIAEAFGADVRRVDVEWGRGIDAERLGRAIEETGPVDAVLLTHNETSTGVLYPLDELVAAVRARSDALVLVDAVSSLGAAPLGLDETGPDVVVSGSQKAWGCPPGLALVLVAARGWEAAARAAMPRYYLDLRRYRDGLEEGQLPFTPALSVLRALDRSLDLLLEEGAARVYDRHEAIARRAREGVEAARLALFAEPAFRSPTVTAVRLPEGVDGAALKRRLRERYDTVVGGGQGRLAGRIVRLGHLGWVRPEEIDAAVDALGRAVAELAGRGGDRP